MGQAGLEYDDRSGCENASAFFQGVGQIGGAAEALRRAEEDT